MKEVWIPEGQEVQNYQEWTANNCTVREKVDRGLNKIRKKSAETAAALLFAAATVGYAGCNIEIQSPIKFKSPTATSVPAPEPTLTPTPVLIPTPEPTPTRIPTATPTKKPTATPRPTPTERPTKTPVPTKTPRPTPTLRPTPTQRPTPTLAPTPTPIELPNITYEVGRERKLEICYRNRSEGTANRSIDFESTGFETHQQKYKGDIKNIKIIEIKVPKTKEEIKVETELARKKAIREGKDPDKIVIDPKKTVKEKDAYKVDPGTGCADIKAIIVSGASPDCYEKVSYNFRSREKGSNNTLLNSGKLLPAFCIEGALEAFIDKNSYEYNQESNTVTFSFRIENPSKLIPQQTKIKIVKPCPFSKGAEQKFWDARTDLRIFPDQPQTIPPETTVLYFVDSILPFGTNTIMLHCTVILERIRPK